MKPSDKLIELVKHFEGCRLASYQDSVGVWTIGWGTTYYEDGTKVGESETITQEVADELLVHHLSVFALGVAKLLTVNLVGYQMDALTDFAYNLGLGNLKMSTLLKKVNTDPGDPTIGNEFLKWNKAGGKTLDGLTRRRMAEKHLWETGELKFNF